MNPATIVGRYDPERGPGVDVELIVVGAGPAYSDRPGAVGAAYLVQAADAGLVLDLGHGTFAGLASRFEPSRLEAILVSHLHADHFIDLVALRHYLRWEFDPPRRASVLGPRGLGERLDALHGEAGFTAAALDVGRLAAGARRIGPFDVEVRPVTHTDESYAFRVGVGAGPGLVYSGDCGQARDVAPLIRPGDVLLAEASFGPGPVDPMARHLDGAMVGDLASATRPGRVLLTHILMGRDREATLAAARGRFDGPVEIVDPGFRLTI